MAITLEAFRDLFKWTKPQRESAHDSRLFTIGYEGRSIDDFLGKLQAQNIRALIDVRANPLSRKPGFSKSSFRERLEKVGIKYYHIPELGVPSKLRRNLDSKEAYELLFDYYGTEILPANLDALERIKGILSDHSRVALTCFEADYQMCHRHKITEYLDQESSFRGTITHLN